MVLSCLHLTHCIIYQLFLMDKDVVHIFNGILLSLKKEWNWVICRDVDRFTVYYSQGNKSEREKLLCINASMCNVKIWYKMIISFLLLAQPTGT